MELNPPMMAVRSIVLGAFEIEENSPPGSRVCWDPIAPDHRFMGR
jgi:hypothetical protein